MKPSMGLIGKNPSKKTPSPTAAKPPRPPARPVPEKRKIVAGLALIALAFFCVLAVFYFLINAHRRQQDELADTRLQVESLSTEKEVADAKISDLQNELEQSPDLDALLDSARQQYGPEETQRREGVLWVDRKNASLIVTLGALNGLRAGSRLIVFDGEERIGWIKIDLPLDVVSTALPQGFSPQELTKDYYRVVRED